MGAGTVVTLVDAGAEPREPLRLQLTAGQEQTVVMTIRMGVGMEVAGSRMPKTAVPPMEMTMALRVLEITAEGDIRSEFNLEKFAVLPDPAVDPGVVEQLKAVLGAMSKLSGTSTITPRGIVKSAQFNIPDDLDPQVRQTMESMRQQINQLSVPFPEEALGVGAEWTVTSHLEQQGMKLQQVVTWRLTERKGSVVKVTNGIQQIAPPQSIVAPGLPPGATVTLNRLASAGTGTTEADLTRPAPLRSEMSLDNSIAMTTEVNGVKTPMIMDMSMRVDIRGE